MSRMMDNLARTMEQQPSQEGARPSLHIVSGIVPDPSAALADRNRQRRMKIAIGAAIGVGIALVILGALESLRLMPDSAPATGTQLTGAPAELSQAVTLIRNGDVKGAESALRSLVAKYPNSRAIRLNHAWTLKELKLYREADAEYQATILKHGRDAHVLNNLAMLYVSTGRATEAEALLKEAVRLDNEFSDAHLNLARLYERTQRLDLSVGHYQIYLEQTGTSPEAQPLRERTRKLNSLSVGSQPGEEKP